MRAVLILLYLLTHSQCSAISNVHGNQPILNSLFNPQPKPNNSYLAPRHVIELYSALVPRGSDSGKDNPRLSQPVEQQLQGPAQSDQDPSTSQTRRQRNTYRDRNPLLGFRRGTNNAVPRRQAAEASLLAQGALQRLRLERAGEALRRQQQSADARRRNQEKKEAASYPDPRDVRSPTFGERSGSRAAASSRGSQTERGRSSGKEATGAVGKEQQRSASASVRRASGSPPEQQHKSGASKESSPSRSSASPSKAMRYGKKQRRSISTRSSPTLYPRSSKGNIIRKRSHRQSLILLPRTDPVTNRKSQPRSPAKSSGKPPGPIGGSQPLGKHLSIQGNPHTSASRLPQQPHLETSSSSAQVVPNISNLSARTSKSSVNQGPKKTEPTPPQRQRKSPDSRSSMPKATSASQGRHNSKSSPIRGQTSARDTVSRPSTPRIRSSLPGSPQVGSKRSRTPSPGRSSPVGHIWNRVQTPDIPSGSPYGLFPASSGSATPRLPSTDFMGRERTPRFRNLPHALSAESGTNMPHSEPSGSERRVSSSTSTSTSGSLSGSSRDSS